MEESFDAVYECGRKLFRAGLLRLSVLGFLLCPVL